MKNYISFGIVLLSLVISSAVMAEMAQQEFEYITAAVEASDVEEVKMLLGLHTFDEKQKNELLEKATTIHTEKKQNIKLLKSQNHWDLALGTLGTVRAVWGTVMVTFAAGAALSCLLLIKTPEPAFVSETTKRLGLVAKTLGLVSACWALGMGMYYVREGWKYSTAVEFYNNAKKIKRLIEEAQIG